MRSLPAPDTNAESKAIVDRLIATLSKDAEAFCYFDRYLHLPIRLYDTGEVPDPTQNGLHLIPAGLELPSVTLNDREDDQFVLVAGDLTCKELWTSGWLFVTGTLRADLVVGRSGCNNMLVCGALEAGALVERGHGITVLGPLQTKHFYSSHGMVTSNNDATHHDETSAADVFAAELLDDDGEVDWDAWNAAGRARRGVVARELIRCRVAAWGIALSLCMGCSLISARVPDKPPAPERCPEGVILADVLGTAFFLIPPAAGLADGLVNGWGEWDGVALLVIGGPMAIIGSVYVGSMIYGLRARSRCTRIKHEEVAAYEAQHRAGATQKLRALQVGDAPMHCAISEPDVGACFTDESECKAEAESGGGACEPRVATWCFDVQDITSSVPRMRCAASLVDCNARRIQFTSDQTATVTTCGTYTVRASQ